MGSYLLNITALLLKGNMVTFQEDNIRHLLKVVTDISHFHHNSFQLRVILNGHHSILSAKTWREGEKMVIPHGCNLHKTLQTV